MNFHNSATDNINVYRKFSPPTKKSNCLFQVIETLQKDNFSILINIKIVLHLKYDRCAL